MNGLSALLGMPYIKKWEINVYHLLECPCIRRGEVNGLSVTRVSEGGRYE